MDNKVQTERPSKALAELIVELEIIKYEMLEVSLAEQIEYEVLEELRRLHSYLVETEQ